MVTVRVFYKRTGRPASGVRVGIIFSGLIGSSIQGFTNRNGDVNFDVEPKTGSIYVGGSFFSPSQKVYEGHISGRINVYIT